MYFFYYTQCAYCNKVNEFIDNNTDVFTQVTKVNVVENPKVIQQLNIQVVPAIFIEGNVYQGIDAAEVLNEIVEDHETQVAQAAEEAKKNKELGSVNSGKQNFAPLEAISTGLVNSNYNINDDSKISVDTAKSFERRREEQLKRLQERLPEQSMRTPLKPEKSSKIDLN
jgi:thioredoxin-like negative regulator of GroEL